MKTPCSLDLITALASLIILACAVSPSGAQDNVLTIPLWEETQLVYPSGDYQEEKIQNEDIIRIGKVTAPLIEVYLPARKNRKKAGVVICPGGGYGILAWDWEGLDIARKLNGAGITAVVLKYRLPFERDGKTDDTMPLRDAMRAIQIVRNHAEEWGLATDQIGIMGFSAGGHLASSVGVHFDDQSLMEGVSEDTTSTRPDFMALIYPVISFTDENLVHAGSRANLLGSDISTQKKEYYSSELQVKENTPPAFLLHAGDDRGVPAGNSLVMYEALLDKNIPADLHIFPYGGHGFGLALDEPRLSGWPDLLIDWILGLSE